LSWEPNVRGVDWFCREVWPLVRRRLPEATLEIAGGGLPTDADGAQIAPPAWRAPGITMLGFVEDLTPLYERSVAMVAPMLGSAGISIKLLEAFRHGVPVVTTPDGAKGLEFEPGREALVESEPDAFAARVVELATSPQARARLRVAAYAFLNEHHHLSAAQTAVRKLIGPSGAPDAASSILRTTSSQRQAPSVASR
ncbi:MAG TPA: glycosyltransferase family 4 protein, partial [Candidatus Limnocylindria bacterium]|nr:glycosyltransferase family 4 protein [Candidatus Limnocylindria bacterium]